MQTMFDIGDTVNMKCIVMGVNKDSKSMVTYKLKVIGTKDTLLDWDVEVAETTLERMQND